MSALRAVAVSLPFLAVAAALWWVAEERMFVGFAEYDDEGYLLISLKSFLGGGALYNEVFSQYGPFYYGFWGGLSRLFAIPITHDSGRLATLCIWIVSCLVIGIMIWRLTRSVGLGLAAQLTAFETLVVMANEPMHPGGLTTLLLVWIAVAAASMRCPSGVPVAAALLGVLFASLILVKINVGAFALIAATLTAAAVYRVFSGRPWLRWAVEIFFILTPLLLMWGKIEEGWVQRYALHVGMAAIGVVLALRCQAPAAPRPGRELRWCVNGLVAAAIAISAVALATGTSIAGLLDGVIWQPLRQAEGFSLPLELPVSVLVVDLIALATATAYLCAVQSRRKPWMMAASSLYSVCVGTVLLLSATDWLSPIPIFRSAFHIPKPLGLVAFAWVALMETTGPEQYRLGEVFRRFLPSLAVLQALHAYPVAGSQIGWSSFLLMPIGAMCIANGFRGFCLEPGRRWSRPVLVCGLVGVMALAFPCLKTQALGYAAERGRRENWAPIALTGARTIRVPPHEAALYRQIAVALNQHCNSVMMLPGMNSFYLWAGQEPPTGFNATAWPGVFSDQLQQRIVDDLQHVENLCLLRNTTLERLWAGGRSFEGRPLVDFLGDGFEPVAKFSSYELLKKQGDARSAAPAGGASGGPQPKRAAWK